MSARPQAGWEHAFEHIADAPIACHELDLEGRIIRINDAGCRLVGLPQSQIVGHYVWEFVASQKQVLDSVERNWVRQDGKRLVLEVHSNYILDSKGSILGLRSFLLDVTRR